MTEFIAEKSLALLFVHNPVYKQQNIATNEA